MPGLFSLINVLHGKAGVDDWASNYEALLVYRADFTVSDWADAVVERFVLGRSSVIVEVRLGVSTTVALDPVNFGQIIVQTKAAGRQLAIGANGTGAFHNITDGVAANVSGTMDISDGRSVPSGTAIEVRKRAGGGTGGGTLGVCRLTLTFRIA